MLSTFLASLKMQLRNFSGIFWVLVFPIILSTLFNAMFGNLSEAYTMQRLEVVVATDAGWSGHPSAGRFIAALSDNADEAWAKDLGQSSPTDSASQSPAAGMLHVTAADSASEARQLLVDDGSYDAMVTVGEDGLLSMAISQHTLNAINDYNNSIGITVSISVLDAVLGLYNKQALTGEEIVAQLPDLAKAAYGRISASDTSSPAFTRQVQLTHFQPDEAARYFYALLGMAALMSLGVAVTAVMRIQPTISDLGARCALAPVPKIRQVCATFLASWLITWCCMTLAMLYIRFGCGVSLGGRELAGVGACAAATFFATALGTLIGCIPGMPRPLRESMATFIACLLSLFSGLYGQSAMALSDWIQQHMPWFATINPAQQITNLFYRLMYFDSYVPFLKTLGVLAAMAAACIIGAAALLRRQRYEHL